MEEDQRQFYRDLFRLARAAALADAEGFHAVFHALELIGQETTGVIRGLKFYQGTLSDLVRNSPLSVDVPAAWGSYHANFDTLYEELRRARNDAVHQGSHARTLTDHAIELTMIVEDALMIGSTAISHFMIRDVVVAKPWFPVSFVRQQMLRNGFSYLPIWHEEVWRLLPEFSLARYLRRDLSNGERSRRLAARVDAAIPNDLPLLSAETVHPTASVSDLVHKIGERPFLVVNAHRKEELMGLISASDIL